jgi:hypothetical protein
MRPLPSLERFSEDYPRYAVKVGVKVTDSLSLCNPAGDAVYRLVGFLLGGDCPTPTEVFDEFEADSLILLSCPLAVCVEHGEQMVKCLLRQNPIFL